MFRSLLIANRGEIACRIIRTARAMGIRTIAVYSDADASARFVRLADEAWRLGPAPARDSYLRAERILDIARASGAEAIHPGYGFLSENAEFAQACADAGVVFVGPPPAAIAAMGSKSAAKQLMERAQVPLTPGYHGDEQDAGFLHQQADQIGYPVLIKASAGGGGKGMRIVERSADFPDALASCRREASASFGDDRVLIERYLQKPRHIEIQVFADQHGEAVYLFERDCSVQRRHQKVLEEAPAPGMDAARRQEMGEAACAAARAVGYVGAGTVEFIVEPDGRFYFMEMNTRLQVEHPVTEMITGQDLVAWQLRVAAGEPLPLRQDALRIHGHAIEARIYAEDPDRDFLPATGQLIRLRPPTESANVRVDTGVQEGDAITPYYDPMIAKLIVWGDDRQQALARLDQALADYRVLGLTTNIAFLRRLARHPAFAGADLDTGLIARHQAELLPPASALPDADALVAAACWLLAGEAAATPRHGWRLNAECQRRLALQYGEHALSIGAHLHADGSWSLSLPDGAVGQARAQRNGSQLSIQLDARRLHADCLQHGDALQVYLPSGLTAFTLPDPYAAEADIQHGDTHLKAPMPGRVVALLAPLGEAVEKGAPLMILEAMKMEHTLVAPGPGHVAAYYFAVGEQVSEGSDLLDFVLP